ncbi:unnamed protein product [Rhizophagus irregularis]|nr:unnamed protein product [Rhizophagus irregularis]CAB4418612.1 unnamed protein product [Rhizophagus irregularis]
MDHHLDAIINEPIYGKTVEQVNHTAHAINTYLTTVTYVQNGLYINSNQILDSLETNIRLPKKKSISPVSSLLILKTLAFNAWKPMFIGPEENLNLLKSIAQLLYTKKDSKFYTNGSLITRTVDHQQATSMDFGWVKMSLHPLPSITYKGKHHSDTIFL